MSRSVVLASMAVLQAYRGEDASARSLVAEAMTVSEAHGNELLLAKLRAILCFIELSVGRPGAALAELGPLRADPITSVFPFAGDGVEALIGTGQFAEALTVLARLEAYAAQTGLRMFHLLALRCRGLLWAATGRHEQALETLEEAAALAAELQLPLERGRTSLALGQVRRRAKQKRAAREALEAAHAAFVAFGAERWVDRAEEELGRIGGRTRERWELTVTEQRVAEHVARGLTNREVAGTLVISVRAVEANLTRIYAKLGVRPRTELAHMLAQRERTQPQP
jgi:DNA-binding CsgD family transcriptional regulator